MCDLTSVFMTVREIELRVFVFRDVLGVKRTRDIFKPVRETHRTYCNVFRTCMSHKINEISKRSATPPKNRDSQLSNALSIVFISLKVVEILRIEVLSVQPPKYAIRPLHLGDISVNTVFQVTLYAGKVQFCI